MSKPYLYEQGLTLSSQPVVARVRANAGLRAGTAAEVESARHGAQGGGCFLLRPRAGTAPGRWWGLRTGTTAAVSRRNPSISASSSRELRPHGRPVVRLPGILAQVVQLEAIGAVGVRRVEPDQLPLAAAEVGIEQEAWDLRGLRRAAVREMTEDAVAHRPFPRSAGTWLNPSITSPARGARP